MTGGIAAHLKGNVVAYLALCVALGGTSYAAITLPANSVGTRQDKNNAITSGKVRDGRPAPGTSPPARCAAASAGLRDRPARSPTGCRAARRCAGVSRPATAARPTLSATSPPRRPFGAQLAAAPPRTIVMNPPGPPQCPGTVADPQAAPGHLCIYTSAIASRSARSKRIGSIETIVDGGGVGGTTRQGAGIYVTSATTGIFGARGSWAVTVP